MGITIQSFVGIGHSVDFWALSGKSSPSAENPPPSAKNSLHSAEKHAPLAENLPPPAVNIPPQQKILSTQQRYPRYKVVFAWNWSITCFCIFILLGMSMEITMQSFLGIGHSIDFWRSAENPPPLSRKSSPLSGKYSPSAENPPSSAEIPEIQGRICLKSINNVFCIFLLLYMSMGITIQSCLGIVHSVHFWCSAENLPPQWNILPP